MARRRFNPRLAKSRRSYTVREIADLYDVHKHTVRSWIAGGLPVLDDDRPTLVHGSDLGWFLANRRKQAKQPCRPGQLYCVACRSPKHPAGDMAECIVAPSSGNLRGICPDCNRLIYRRVSLPNLASVRGGLEISFTQAEPRIRGTAPPSSNCDPSDWTKR